MRRTIAVHLGKEETPLGTLFHDQHGAREIAAFEYGAQWLGSAGRFAIEPGLPLVAGPQFHRKTREGSVFHAALADTEPDGWGRRVIQRDHAKRRQEARRAGASVEARPLNALDYLLAVDAASFRTLVFDYENPLAGSYAVEAATLIPIFKLGKVVKFGPKITGQLATRGWNQRQITEAIEQGRAVRAVNRRNGNPATRYVHPQTGQSVVVDDITGEVIHVGGPGFRYGPNSGNL